MAKDVMLRAEEFLRYTLSDWAPRPEEEQDGVKAVLKVLTQFEIRITKDEDFEPYFRFCPIWKKRARS